MRIVIACGGTGGHVVPGVAVARELRRRGYAAELWLAGRDVERLTAAGWDGTTVRMRARGLAAGSPARAFLGAASLAAAVPRCIARMRRGRRPAAVLAMGGYASVGPGLAARILGIPLILHEANAIPGRAVAILSRRAAAVAVAFPEAAAHFKAAAAVVTGFPLREPAEATDDDFEGALPFPAAKRFTALVAGGSQGARFLNDIAVDAFCRARARGSVFQVVHLAGPSDEERVRRAYRRAGVDAAVFGFLRRMDRAYAAARLAVCRAGAATCAELAAAGIPALLVPLPGAVHDHQTANAMLVASAGAADLIAQDRLRADWLADYLAERMDAPALLADMRTAALERAVPHAAARVADLVASAAARAGVSAGAPPPDCVTLGNTS